MVQCRNDVLLSQLVYERCHSAPLHDLVCILFHMATLHLSHFVKNVFFILFVLYTIGSIVWHSITGVEMSIACAGLHAGSQS